MTTGPGCKSQPKDVWLFLFSDRSRETKFRKFKNKETDTNEGEDETQVPAVSSRRAVPLDRGVARPQREPPATAPLGTVSAPGRRPRSETQSSEHRVCSAGFYDFTF